MTTGAASPPASARVALGIWDEYRDWSGQLSGRTSRIATMAIGEFIQSVRSTATLVLYILTLVMTGLAMLLFLVGVWFGFTPVEPETLQTVLGSFWLFVFLISASTASRLVSDDFANRTIVLYVSRPLTRIDYLVGKLGAMSIFYTIGVLIPTLGFTLALIRHGTVTDADWLNRLYFFGGTLANWALVILVFGSASIALSSTIRKKWWAFAAILVAFMFTHILSSGMAQIFNNPWLSLISLWSCVEAVDAAVLGVRSPMDGVPTYAAAAVLAFTIIVSWVALLWRLSSQEAEID